jgi:WD40 repeat protein
MVLGGLEDCLLTVWRVQKKSRFPATSTPAWSFKRKATLTGHTSSITRLAVSHKYGALVSSAEDGTVLLWDLNKAAVIRPILEKRRFPFPISALQVCTGSS